LQLLCGGIKSSNKPIGAQNVLGLSNKKGGEWFENTVKFGSIAICPLLLALGLNKKAFTLKFDCNFNNTINITITKHIAQCIQAIIYHTIAYNVTTMPYTYT